MFFQKPTGSENHKSPPPYLDGLYGKRRASFGRGPREAAAAPQVPAVQQVLLTNCLVARLSLKHSIAGLPRQPGHRGKTMPPKKSSVLTEAELRLMKILWRRGESAVNDLLAAIPDAEPLAYNSVLTTIRILEQKGYVEHRQEGRAFIYRPCVAEKEAGQTEVRNVLSRFFGNSRERLLLSLLGDVEISPEELERLKDAIRSAPPDQPTAKKEM